MEPAREHDRAVGERLQHRTLERRQLGVGEPAQVLATLRGGEVEDLGEGHRERVAHRESGRRSTGFPVEGNLPRRHGVCWAIHDAQSPSAGLNKRLTCL